MSKGHAFAACCLLLVTGWRLSTAHATCVEQTVTFNPNQGYSYNYGWSHTLPELPEGCVVTSCTLTVRAQVWYWGYYPYRQDVVCSDTTTFYLSEGLVGSLSTSTNPSSSNFYTTTFQLQANQIPWVLNDGGLHVIMVTYGGTYYLEYSTLEICIEPLENDLVQDCTIDLLDLAFLAERWLLNDCGTDNWCANADMDQSGQVDLADFAQLANQWLIGN